MREKLREENPTARLNHLQTRRRELGAEIHEAQNGQGRTQKELALAREQVNGSERATRPADLAMRADAQRRLATLKEQAQDDLEKITALQTERSDVDEALAALYGTAAIQLYKDAKRRAAAAESAHAALQAQVGTAATAVDSARQTAEAARGAATAALDLDSVTRARNALETATAAELAAQALADNLNQRLKDLEAERAQALNDAKEARQKVFEVQASHLAEVAANDRQLEPILKAYAAAKLAGTGWNLGEWLNVTIDAERVGPYLEALEQEIERG